MGAFIDRFGARPVLVTGALAGIVGFLAPGAGHSAPWQVIVAGIATNAYISLAYGALPALVVSEADPGETGVATSVNAIARTVGSSVAAAVVAVLLAHTAGGTGLPGRGRVRHDLRRRRRHGRVGDDTHRVVRHPATQAESPSATVDSRAMNHEWG